IKFAGRSSTGIQRNYAKITGKILDVTNGSEDGILEFSHIRNGSQAITGRWRSDSLQLLNDTNLSVAGDTTLTSDLDVDGHTKLDNVSIAGVTTASDNIRIIDSKKLLFGDTNGDMSMYHLGGANSYIVNKANNLYIQSNNAVEIGSVDTNGSNVETSARFIRNGAAELYHNDLKRLETSSVGVSIPQDLTVDGHTNLDNVSIVGVTTFNGLSTNDVIRVRSADSNGNCVVNILSEGTTGNSRILFSDTAATSGDGWISYSHNDRAITFTTAGTSNERLRITGAGLVGIGTDTPTYPLQVHSSSA
ncbi:MAG: hypothetical protein VXY93_13240, partial [Pseudomonadota bacterium]|nr:hypothetical protein [Pseudomonadota bacterium]